MPRYREEVAMYSDDEIEEGTLYISKEDFEEIMDSIEKRVDEALSKINNIKGIEIIEECAELLGDLSNDVY